jgi:hypothetical protein
MQAAYLAACTTGYLPVLSLLLGHAAAAPQQQLPALLKALINRGSVLVAELLLGDTQAAIQQLQQQDPAAAATGEQQQDPAAAVLRHVQLLRAALHSLTAKEEQAAVDWAQPSRFSTGTVAVPWSEVDPDAVRLRMTDLLWQALPA